MVPKRLRELQVFSLGNLTKFISVFLEVFVKLLPAAKTGAGCEKQNREEGSRAAGGEDFMCAVGLLAWVRNRSALPAHYSE